MTEKKDSCLQRITVILTVNFPLKVIIVRHIEMEYDIKKLMKEYFNFMEHVRYMNTCISKCFAQNKCTYNSNVLINKCTYNFMNS